jgi:hypothetical protein
VDEEAGIPYSCPAQRRHSHHNNDAGWLNSNLLGTLQQRKRMSDVPTPSRHRSGGWRQRLGWNHSRCRRQLGWNPSSRLCFFRGRETFCRHENTVNMTRVHQHLNINHQRGQHKVNKKCTPTMTLQIVRFIYNEGMWLCFQLRKQTGNRVLHTRQPTKEDTTNATKLK